jgi:hypothetical protein
MQLTYIFLIFFNLLSFKHPFHVSVCDIRHNTETQSLEITHKIFLDDLEAALKPLSLEKLDLFNEANLFKNEDLIKQYLSERFKVYVNGQAVEFNYLGMEKEETTLWCYVEIPKVKKVKSIEVVNRLLMETYPDQNNLIHVEYNGKLKSMKLDVNQSWDSLKF